MTRTTKTTKALCTCGKLVSQKYLAQHKKQYCAESRNLPAVIPKANGVVKTVPMRFVRMSPALLLEDNEGHVWIAERYK